MNIKYNWIFKLGCLNMCSLVLLGARFGHVGKLNENGAALFQKAQVYNVANSLGFFASSLITSTRLPFKVAVGGFIVGQVLFVLPLYLTAIYGRNQYLSKIMPVGGVSMVLSWLGLLFA